MRSQLLKQLRLEVARRLGPEPVDLKSYTKRYERELNQPFEISSKAELLSEIERADIVYGGDFHALGPAQRTHVKILRSLSDDRPIAVALECFAVGVQRWLDAYVNGTISIDELRKRTKWDRDWGFPWDNYRPIFELARRRRWKLLALSSVSRGQAKTKAQLTSREHDAANILKTYHLRNLGTLLYVIFGDLHLASGHLPQAVKKVTARYPLSEVIVHLNSEKIYFDLASEGLELAVDVVRFGAKPQFCVLSSPPWVKWQSYLFFLDRTAELEIDDRLDDVGEFDPTDQVARLVQLAAFDLGLELKLDELAVYADDESIWRSAERLLNQRDRETARYLLANARSFYLPSGGVAYLSRPTVNHAASIAGEYLHAKVSKRARSLWRFPQDFKGLIWMEAVAYFISKLVNHKRQAETLGDLKSQLAMAGPQDQARETLRLAIDTSFSELIWIRQKRRRALRVRPRRKSSYVDAARILGGMMGERLYLAFRSRRLKREEIVAWLQVDASARGFGGRYDSIVARLSSIGDEPVKPRKERL